MNTSRTSRLSDFFDSYTKDLTAEDLQRLFTRDARDAYKFFTRGVDAEALRRMPWHRRFATEVRLLFIAFSMKLSPARRVVFGGALLLALVGMISLFKGVGIVYLVRVPIIGGLGTPGPLFQAGTWSLFRHILLPLLVPGVLAAAVLVLVRTVGMFELTYLTAGTDSQTLVVVLYNSYYGAGIRAPQASDAMAVIYMLTMLVLLVIALRFVNPTQLVTRVADERDT